MLAAIYGVPGVLLLVHVLVGLRELGFMPSLGARIAARPARPGLSGHLFPAGRGDFPEQLPPRVARNAAAAIEMGDRRTLAGIVPFLLLYIVPYFLGVVPRPWMNFSAVSLVLIPLCFAYAIIRYRLMDVDIIFKRGLAYTAASGGVVAVYIAMVALIGALFHTAWPSGHDGRGHRHRGGGVSVPAVSRLDSGAPGPLFLPRPPRLSPHAD